MSVGGQTTTYGYDPVGQLITVALPDGSGVQYGYDPAHRLRRVTNNRGDRIDYLLDSSGNATEESVSDGSGTLRRQISRSFDALNRVWQSIGGD